MKKHGMGHKQKAKKEIHKINKQQKIPRIKVK